MSELAKDITPVSIEDELKTSYLDYAMSVIVGRALPDVRDGLKPVHRRVLFSMDQNNNTYKKTKFHNFNETFTQYTSDELDEIIKKSQKEKFK